MAKPNPEFNSVESELRPYRVQVLCDAGHNNGTLSIQATDSVDAARKAQGQTMGQNCKVIGCNRSLYVNVL